MSVSRDFIDCYSPKSRTGAMLTVHSAFTACGRGRTAGEAAPPRHYGAITLAFGFRGGHDFGQPTVSFRQAGCFFLTLGKKSFERQATAQAARRPCRQSARRAR